MTVLNEGNTSVVPCPICKSIPNQETGQCRCHRTPGRWIPTANMASEELTSEAPVIRAESLFDKYLAARLVRARRALTVAKVALLRDPSSRLKLKALRSAEAETEKLHAQVLAQTSKTTSARKRVSTSTPPRESEAPPVSPEATQGFRMIQAAKAEVVYQSAEAAECRRVTHPDDRECPKCSKRMHGDATACACGHQFSSVAGKVVAEPFLNEEPFLTQEELAALRGKPLRRAE